MPVPVPVDNGGAAAVDGSEGGFVGAASVDLVTGRDAEVRKAAVWHRDHRGAAEVAAPC